MAEGAGGTLIGHARHDPLRVAEAVDRGGRLAPVMRFCDPCGQLYADLVALTGALSLSAFPARPRDFRLRAADARRLRHAGWRARLSVLGSARDTVTRPLAIGVTTLGLAGLILTAIPALTPSAGAGADPVREFVAAAASDAPGTSAPNVSGVDVVPAPGDVPVDPGAAGPSATLVLSVGLLAGGGSLFAARRLAERARRVR